MADCKDLSGDRLHVSVDENFSNNILQCVHARVKTPEWNLIVDEGDFEGAFQVYFDCSERHPEKKKKLDLVAHSIADDCLLKLGQDWVIEIDANETLPTQPTFSGLVDTFKKIGVSEIRLLGCQTAVTPNGQATMKNLQKIMDDASADIEVKGTNTYVYLGDFDKNGFKESSETKLKSARNLPPATGAPTTLLPTDAAPVNALALASFAGVDRDRLREIGGLDVKFIRRRRLHDTKLLDNEVAKIKESTHSSGRVLPGLLMLPAFQYAVRHPTQDEHWILFELLFDNGPLCVYGDDPCSKLDVFMLKPGGGDIVRSILENGSTSFPGQ